MEAMSSSSEVLVLLPGDVYFSLSSRFRSSEDRLGSAPVSIGDGAALVANSGNSLSRASSNSLAWLWLGSSRKTLTRAFLASAGSLTALDRSHQASTLFGC